MKEQKDFWGPKLWKLIHTVSYYAPENISDKLRKEYYYFFTFLVPRCIMCIKCQLHYRRMMEKLQFDCQNRNDIINYSIELHNRVNRRLRKQQLARNDVDKIYQNKSVYIKEIYELIIWYKGNVQYGSFTKYNFKLLLLYLTKLLPYVNLENSEKEVLNKNVILDKKEMDIEDKKKNIEIIKKKIENNPQKKWEHPTNQKVNGKQVINI